MAAIRLRAAADALLPRLAMVAARLVRLRAWDVFGFARLDNYARERLDRSGRWVRDMAALGEGIDRMPSLAAAVTGADGGAPLGRVAAVLIGRIATPESVSWWIRLARGSTVRQLRAWVARARAKGSHWPEGDAAAGGLADPVPGAGSQERPITDADRIGSTDGPVGDPAGENGFDAEAEERVLVRLLVPQAIRVAFDETLQLHRAVTGHEATVTSFIEALVAEAYAGSHPPDSPDADSRPLRVCPDEAASEDRLARRTGRWKHLPTIHGVEGSLRELPGGLDGFEDGPPSSRTLGIGAQGRLDQRLRALIDLESRIHRRLGEVLARMGDRGAWSALRFRGLRHYAEERLGLGRSATADRVRLHRTLANFPRIREAYEQGDLGLEAALAIVRLLGRGPVEPELERAWVDRARTASVKRLRDETRHLRRATRSPSELAPLDDAGWHETLRRDPGRTRHEVRELGEQVVPDEADPLSPGVTGFPDVFLGLRLPRDVADAFLATIESCRRNLTAEVETLPWEEASPAGEFVPSWCAARMFSRRARRVPSWVALLALLEDYAATWDDPEAMPHRKADRIYRRDGWRCMAPGCTSRDRLEAHHVIYRSRNGGDEASNQICLCSFHHRRGEHGGLASCSGRAPLGILWRLGREDLATYYRNELRVAEDASSP